MKIYGGMEAQLHYGSAVELASTEMSTTDLPGGKGRPACKADNLTAICEETL
jgi:hypothetical protein